jgi:hypothetical protein
MMRGLSGLRIQGLRLIGLIVVALGAAVVGFNLLQSDTVGASPMWLCGVGAVTTVLHLGSIVVCSLSAALGIAYLHFFALAPIAGNVFRLTFIEMFEVDPAALLELIPTSGLVFGKTGAATQPASPAKGWRWPVSDVDITTATDGEDLVVFMADIAEFISQDVTLLVDACGEGLLGVAGVAGLVWGVAKLRRVLSARFLKR